MRTLTLGFSPPAARRLRMGATCPKAVAEGVGLEDTSMASMGGGH